MDDFKNKILKVSIQHQGKIQSALKQIKELFGVNYFYYSRVSNFGMYTSFSSNPSWNKLWFDQKLHKETFYFLQPQNYFSRETVSMPFFEDPFKKTQALASENFNINYLLEVTIRDHLGIEAYGFSSEKVNGSTVKLFLTGLPCLKLFFKKFQEGNRELFHQLHHNQVDISKEIGPDFFKVPPGRSKEALSPDFLNSLGFHILADLSEREREICKLMTKGLSAGQMADHLDLSKRTVEYYIENIKTKLDCFSKVDMIKKCLDLETIGYFDDTLNHRSKRHC